MCSVLLFFFFFQAEDGIRDKLVTGVKTCALPICNRGYGDRGYGDRGYGNVGYGAFQNGASDGYRKGLEDIQKRRYPDVTRHSWYRNGDHDYDRAYGSKDAYKVEYRRGFQEGYNRAFREGRRY